MKKFIYNNWIFILIIAQPILDVIAFFNASESGTASGYIRLAIMIVLLFYTVICNYKNKKMWLFLVLFGLVFSLHIFNGFRVGYKDLSSDLSYCAKVAYMPVLAIVFCLSIDKKNISKQVFNGVIINAFLITLVLVASYLTDTYTDTYGPGLGISGWVIGENRCCHSDILSSCCVFLGYLAISNNKRIINVSVPILIFALLLTNGTQACFYTLFGIFVGYPVYSLVKSRVVKQQFNKLTSFVMLFLAVLTVFIYPYTPRYKMEMYERSFYSDVQIKFVSRMNEMGYDIENMTPEQRMSDDVVHQEMVDYYLPFLYSGMPDRTVEAFDIDRIIWKYNATIDATAIGDNRDMKEIFASLMFEDCDFVTRCFGFEFATIGEDLTADLENDWYAVLYYYGYFGFAVYIICALYLLGRILKLLRADFKSCFTDDNFCILMCFILQIGLAFFSGAVLRRPNASIYLSLVVGLLYFATRRDSIEA